MTGQTRSGPNGEDFTSSRVLCITITFLVTAVVLWWDPLGRAEPLTPYRPAHSESTLPALTRARRESILYYGSENCKGCHSKREYKKLWNDWTKGGHKDVECEACHGPAGDHALKDVDSRPKTVVAGEMLARPHVLCMGCHAELPGRQTTVRQIEAEKHLADFQVNKGDPEYEVSLQCLSCHDAHRPVKIN